MPRILFCSLRRGTHPGHMHTRVLMQSENGGDSSGYLQRSPLGGKPGDDVPIFLEVTVKFQVLNAEHVLILQSGKNSNKLLSIIILREGRHFHWQLGVSAKKSKVEVVPVTVGSLVPSPWDPETPPPWATSSRRVHILTFCALGRISGRRLESGKRWFGHIPFFE